MQPVICSLQSAVLRSAVCGLRSAVCSLQSDAGAQGRWLKLLNRDVNTKRYLFFGVNGSLLYFVYCENSLPEIKFPCAGTTFHAANV